MKVILIKNNNPFDITDLVQNVSWGGNINQVSRSLTFQILYSEDYYTPKLSIDNGDLVKLLDQEEKIIISGVVFTKVTDRAGGTINITVYDPLIYLTKNMTTKVVDNIRVTEFITSLCDEFGITIAKIPSIQSKLEGVFRDMSLYDMILKALEEYTQLTQIDYLMKMDSKGLVIETLGHEGILIDLETGSDEIYTITVTESIEALRNVVLVRGKGDNIFAEAVNAEMISRYGRMQHQVTEDNMDRSKSKIYAQNLLKDLCKASVDISLQMKGNVSIKAGDKLTLVDKGLGIDETYIIEEDGHNMTESGYTMHLKLIKR
ncbi:hypothetical protein [Fusibacter sp. 3D3]|uniref:XkdQ/YqbQ family protein n=1 Tax=Fusibacter sp. 3D3 TaxID=1048380 RepID=UPI00085308DC|nr:hypothetical protein [Fusibacter sp. 3D3]GAU79506.1 phage-like element PBSX protein xkdQ [Fusibacter sp. 3D3]